jgi:ribonuclease J
MRITIHRGTHEIGGTLIELRTGQSRLLIDAGYPLFLKGLPIEDNVAKLPPEKLLEIGVLPQIIGLYQWDSPSFDAVIISHAHIDHYGLLKYINPDIPIYMSHGTKKLIEISNIFGIYNATATNTRIFDMYNLFKNGDFSIKPYLMDHSAFDAAAFEILAEDKTIIYSGDFRGHGRKAICLDKFITSAKKQSDLLLTEGTMFGRQDEKIITESELEYLIKDTIEGRNSPVLFQSSSQNIDRIVSFYRVSLKLGKTFIIDVYTANILYELRQLGNRLPYPSTEYSNIKVFYPYRMTQKIFNEIDEKYAKRFSSFHISKEKLRDEQNNIIMMVRPSMLKDIEKCKLHDGVFIYSMWQGYRDSEYQQKFESYLQDAGFIFKAIHTSGHASVSDIKRLITGLNPKKIIPIHTMVPDAFNDLSDKIELKEDGKEFEV